MSDPMQERDRMQPEKGPRELGGDPDSQLQTGPDPTPDEEEYEEDEPRNPFDNPYFLPVLLLGLSIWFGYDGWFNADAHMQKWRGFNQIGFAVLVVLGIWFLVRARKETRVQRGADGGEPRV
jgi:hypothetical protein